MFYIHRVFREVLAQFLELIVDTKTTSFKKRCLEPKFQNYKACHRLKFERKLHCVSTIALSSNLQNNTRTTVLFISLKYANSGNEEIKNFINKTRLKTAEIFMVITYYQTV